MILIGLLWSYLEKRVNTPEQVLQAALDDLKTKPLSAAKRPISKYGKRDR
jgi:hypothetical protein